MSHIKFHGLDALRARLAGVASGQFVRDLPVHLADTATNEVATGFQDGKSPYDEPWTPSIRAKIQGGQTLRDKGALASSWSADALPGVLRVGTMVTYAHVHQEGMTIKAKTAPFLRFKIGNRWASKKSVTIPQRMMLPDPKQGLGPRWRGAFQDAAMQAWRDYMSTR